MSHVPSIQIDPVYGPKLIMTNVSGDIAEIMLDTNGNVCLSGQTGIMNNLSSDDVPYWTTHSYEETMITKGKACKLKMTFELEEETECEIFCSFSWRLSNSSKSILVFIVVNEDEDNPIWDMKVRPRETDQSIPEFVIKSHTFPAGNNSIELCYQPEDTKKIAYMKNAYMKVRPIG